MIFPHQVPYPVGIEVALGDCRDTDTQYITILEEGEGDSRGRVAREPLVRAVRCFIPILTEERSLSAIVLRDLRAGARAHG